MAILSITSHTLESFKADKTTAHKPCIYLGERKSVMTGAFDGTKFGKAYRTNGKQAWDRFRNHVTASNFSKVVVVVYDTEAAMMAAEDTIKASVPTEYWGGEFREVTKLTSEEILKILV